MKNSNITELDMVQLNTINGGTFGQVTDDSELLHKLGLMDEDFNTFETIFSWDSCSEKVEAAWKKVGVTCISYPNFDNTYYYQGHAISWSGAQQAAKDMMIKGPQIGQSLPGQ